jgi:hypothetical protein
MSKSHSTLMANICYGRLPAQVSRQCYAVNTLHYVVLTPISSVFLQSSVVLLKSGIITRNNSLFSSQAK